MATFVSDFLLCKDGYFVALKFIEGIKKPSPEDMTANKLLDDIIFEIRTTSGSVHTVSTKEQISQSYSATIPIEQWFVAVADRWKFILTGKSQ